MLANIPVNLTYSQYLHMEDYLNCYKLVKEFSVLILRISDSVLKFSTVAPLQHFCLRMRCQGFCSSFMNLLAVSLQVP
jgi:hypothetical protein